MAIASQEIKAGKRVLPRQGFLAAMLLLTLALPASAARTPMPIDQHGVGYVRVTTGKYEGKTFITTGLNNMVSQSNPEGSVNQTPGWHDMKNGSRYCFTECGFGFPDASSR